MEPAHTGRDYGRSLSDAGGEKAALEKEKKLQTLVARTNRKAHVHAPHQVTRASLMAYARKGERVVRVLSITFLGLAVLTIGAAQAIGDVVATFEDGVDLGNWFGINDNTWFQTTGGRPGCGSTGSRWGRCPAAWARASPGG